MVSIRKRFIAIGLAAALALIAFAAPAYAYFTDILSASGSHDIVLGYSFEVKEKHEDPQEDLTGKVISIKNTGETDIMARVFVSDAMDGIEVGVSKASEDWYSEPVPGGTMWTYKWVIPPNGISAELKVDISGDIPDKYPYFDLIVSGQASEVAYDESGNAYAVQWQPQSR